MRSTTRTTPLLLAISAMLLVLAPAAGSQPDDPAALRQMLEARLKWIRATEARLEAALAELDAAEGAGHVENEEAATDQTAESAEEIAAEPQAKSAPDRRRRPFGEQRERGGPPPEGGRPPPPPGRRDGGQAPIEDDPTYQRMQRLAPGLADRMADQSRRRPDLARRNLELLEPRLDLLEQRQQFSPQDAGLRLKLIEIDTEFETLLAAEPDIAADDPRLLELATQRFEAQNALARAEVTALEQRLSRMRTGVERRERNQERAVRFMVRRALERENRQPPAEPSDE